MNSNMLNDIHKRACEEKLREAAATGDLDIIKSLIEKGVDVNSQNIINHWTALHWSCKRGHSSIVSYLLSHGADASLMTINHETCWQLAPDAKFSVPFTGEIINSSNNNSSPFIPNYLAHPVFPYGKRSENDFQNGSYQQTAKLSTASSERDFYTRNYLSSARELVLKIKLEKDKDFIEVDFPDRDLLTYVQLLDEMCRELDAPMECSLKIRKLPNTIIRNDRDVRRLDDFQELELITNS